MGMFTPTIPTCTSNWKRRAAPPSRVKMATPLPYGLSLTSWTASSYVSTRSTDRTGPKISSSYIPVPGRTPSTSDGRDDLPAGAGFFLRPSLVDGVRPGTGMYDDEIFGPVLSVLRVDTYDEAVQLVNDNPYGNGVAIFTRDGGAARRFQFDVQVGMVGVNIPIPVPVAYYSFGGWKASLFGDTHMYGPDVIHFYTRTKVVTSRWPDPSTSRVDLGFPRSH